MSFVLDGDSFVATFLEHVKKKQFLDWVKGAVIYLIYGFEFN